MKVCGVYEIRCFVSNRAYCGSALNIFNRWDVHKLDLRKNRHHCSALQKAWNKHGASNFVFDILECCPAELRLVREQFWLDADPTFVYNSARLVGHPSELNRALASRHIIQLNKTLPWTQERRRAAAERVKRRMQNWVVSLDTKAKQSASAKARKAREKLEDIAPPWVRHWEVNPRPKNLCNCGCGKEIRRRSVFARGHYPRRQA